MLKECLRLCPALSNDALLGAIAHSLGLSRHQQQITIFYYDDDNDEEKARHHLSEGTVSMLVSLVSKEPRRLAGKELGRDGSIFCC